MHYRTFLSTTALLALPFALALTISGCGEQDPSPADSASSQSTAQASGQATGQATGIENSVADYIKDFPYQDSYDYAIKYTGGDPARFNSWVIGAEPSLVKAGDDKVVRMNNDTYYKLAFLLLDQGPVTLASEHPSTGRFNSYQLMDERNVNFRNLIHPSGKYTLYYGAKPDAIEGEAIESPSALVAVIVRVEVKDMNNAEDIADAKAIFAGLTIEGPAIQQVPKLDRLSAYDDAVTSEARKRIDETFQNTDFSQLVAGPGDVPDKVSYLQLAAGTKGGWGGPVTSHSAYETVFFDAQGKEMRGSNGSYTITTSEPPVDAFWSITVYDTDRGGFLHPNKDNRYHINNTSAVKSEDGNYRFVFKQQCEQSDINCLAVPAGRFDYAVRYYLPKQTIRDGDWRMPKATL